MWRQFGLCSQTNRIPTSTSQAHASTAIISSTITRRARWSRHIWTSAHPSAGTWMASMMMIARIGMCETKTVKQCCTAAAARSLHDPWEQVTVYVVDATCDGCVGFCCAIIRAISAEAGTYCAKIFACSRRVLRLRRPLFCTIQYLVGKTRFCLKSGFTS
jgi:hypothetical protein